MNVATGRTNSIAGPHQLETATAGGTHTNLLVLRNLAIKHDKTLNGLVEMNIYRKPYIFPLNMGFSCDIYPSIPSTGPLTNRFVAKLLGTHRRAIGQKDDGS